MNLSQFLLNRVLFLFSFRLSHFAFSFHVVLVQVEKQLAGLQGAWLSFQQCLIDSDSMLKKHKEKFRTGLLHSAEELKKTVTHLLEDFESKGPFSSDVRVTSCKCLSSSMILSSPPLSFLPSQAALPDALQFIATMREQVANLKNEEETIRRGLNIFKIDQPRSNLIVTLEKV